MTKPQDLPRKEHRAGGSELTFSRQKLIRFFFFAAFAFVCYQLFFLARPFLTALLLAAMLAMGFLPAYLPLKRVLKNQNLAAFILTLGIFLAIVIPLVGIIWFLIKEADRLLPTLRTFMSTLQTTDLMTYKERFPAFMQTSIEPVLHFFDTTDIQPQEKILAYAGVIGAKITSLGALTARNALITFINVIVFIIALFFAFRDGEALYRWALSLIPMDDEHKKALAKRAYETFMAVMVGVIVTAGAQGITAMIGFLIAGVKLPVILGLAVSIASFFGASFLITVPVAISMFQDSLWRGIFLLIWGMGVVGIMDNFLKPILIGSRARMPFVLIFFSIVGGVKAYGILGFVLGPVIVASFLTFVNIYRKGFDMRARTSEDDISPS